MEKWVWQSKVHREEKELERKKKAEPSDMEKIKTMDGRGETGFVESRKGQRGGGREKEIERGEEREAGAF